MAEAVLRVWKKRSENLTRNAERQKKRNIWLTFSCGDSIEELSFSFWDRKYQTKPTKTIPHLTESKKDARRLAKIHWHERSEKNIKLKRGGSLLQVKQLCRESGWFKRKPTYLAGNNHHETSKFLQLILLIAFNGMCNISKKMNAFNKGMA